MESPVIAFMSFRLFSGQDLFSGLFCFYAPSARRMPMCTTKDLCAKRHHHPFDCFSWIKIDQVRLIVFWLCLDMGLISTCGTRRHLSPHPPAWQARLCRSWVQGSPRTCWPGFPPPGWTWEDETLGNLELRFWRPLSSSSPKGRWQKKHGKMWEFWKNRGGVYPNPTSFVIWPSVFWHAKFILRC